jgi:DNA polymerase elongation subunit (family B)
VRRAGPFKVFNEKDEEAVLRKFVAHIQELRPHVVVTYNGDKFDWPYVETRCKKYSYLNLYTSLGIRSTAQPSGGGAGGASKEGNGKSMYAFLVFGVYLSLAGCCISPSA